MGAARSGDVVVPGDAVGSTEKYLPEKNTHVLSGMIYASVVGRLYVGDAGASDAAGKRPVSIVREQGATVLPEIGSEVVARVLRINPRLAAAEIVCVGETPLREPLHGTIRVQDVRDYEIDRCKIAESFRPGDIIRAEVISLGDARAYFLSTAKVHLGVVHAKSTAGHEMEPASHCEMECTVSHTREKRKVAKPGHATQEKTPQ